jgi:hypothetical protein
VLRMPAPARCCGFADDPLPALASLSIGEAALRSAATLIAAGLRDDGIHAATITLAGSVARGTRSIQTTSPTSSGPFAPTPGRGRRSIDLQVRKRRCAARPVRLSETGPYAPGDCRSTAAVRTSDTCPPISLATRS